MSLHHLSTRAARNAGGAALLVAGVTILMGIITAEALRPPGYSTARNDISDLGVAVQPSATLFDIVMVVSGLLLLLGAYGVYRGYQSRAVGVPLTLLGLGVLGVGLFPGDPNNPVHPWVSLLAFVSGGVAAALAVRVARGPFRVLSLILGVTALGCLVLAEISVLTDALGVGGAERWVAYPTVLWLVAFGGYALGDRRIERDRDTPLARTSLPTGEPATGQPQAPANEQGAPRVLVGAAER